MFIPLLCLCSLVAFYSAVQAARIPRNAARVVWQRDLPVSITPSKAFDILNSLEIAPEDESIPYKRTYFPTWDKTSIENCNVRDYVLIRDGVDVLVDQRCYPYRGEWTSPYDLQQTSTSKMLDIDHLVPLKEAWISGANMWTADERESFANDIILPQLLAVSRHSNRAKGDQDPAKWLPDNEQFHCDYVLSWIQVKGGYSLTVDEAERDALLDVLNTC